MMAAIEAWEQDTAAGASPQPDSPPREAEARRVNEEAVGK